MSRHVLVVNRFDSENGQYHRYIDHDLHRVAYLTSRAGAAPIDEERAEVVVEVGDLTNWKDVCTHAKAIVDAYGPIDDVIALSEYDLELGAWLREQLGVPGLTSEDIARVRDKVTMKTLLSAAGLRVPRFVVVDSPETVRQFASTVGLPLILKPRRGWDSQGVFLVRSEASLESVLREHDLADYECEEFITGTMHHIDGVAQNGRVKTLRSARMVASCLDFALGQPSGSVANDDEHLEQRFVTYTEGVLAALGIQTSAFHLEVFLTENNDGLARTLDRNAEDIVFLEIGARVGGAQIPHLWREVYGVDLFAAWVRMLLGEDLDTSFVGAAAEVGGYLLIPEPPIRPCRVTSTTSLVDRIPQLYAETLPGIGTVLAGTGGGKETGGQFRFRGATSMEVEHAMARAADEYHLGWEPLPPGEQSRQLPPGPTKGRAQAVACP